MELGTAISQSRVHLKFFESLQCFTRDQVNDHWTGTVDIYDALLSQLGGPLSLPFAIGWACDRQGRRAGHLWPVCVCGGSRGPASIRPSHALLRQLLLEAARNHQCSAMELGTAISQSRVHLKFFESLQCFTRDQVNDHWTGTVDIYDALLSQLGGPLSLPFAIGWACDRQGRRAGHLWPVCVGGGSRGPASRSRSTS